MQCKICNGKDIKVIYNGLIRNGGLGKYTKEPVKMYQCADCDVIWHEKVLDIKEYYESQEYRKSLEGTSEEKDFYRLHDKETLDKLQYTGTTIFRDKIVADIGCGCGAFLDYLKGVASEIIAIEPSQTYRTIMERKQFRIYPYAEDMKIEKKFWGKVDVATSFDVIEHVESPFDFLKDIYGMLKKGGQAIIGTPTDAPIMRNLLGDVYEKKQLFSTQHLWVLGDKNLKYMAEQLGFSKIYFKWFQRYGIGNMLGWLRDKTQGSAVTDSWVSVTLDGVWRNQLVEKGLADYIVLYLTK